MEGRDARRLKLASAQVRAGEPVWIPPADFAVLLEDILTRRCGQNNHEVVVAFAAAAHRQKIVHRNQLAEIEQITLCQFFGLNVAEAIEFRRAAKWIAFERELELKDAASEEWGEDIE